ncbi:hypothetical protein V8F06_003691 [Rhypophila decipiens]
MDTESCPSFQQAGRDQTRAFNNKRGWFLDQLALTEQTAGLGSRRLALVVATPQPICTRRGINPAKGRITVERGGWKAQMANPIPWQRARGRSLFLGRLFLYAVWPMGEFQVIKVNGSQRATCCLDEFSSPRSLILACFVYLLVLMFSVCLVVSFCLPVHQLICMYSYP